MSWLRLDDATDSHSKWAELSDAECWRWVRVLLYCARHETDGRVSGSVLRRIGWTSAGRARLVALGLLDVDNSEAGGFFVHDFLEYNPSKAERELERERWRKRKRSSRNRGDVTGGVLAGVTGGVSVESQPLRAGSVPLPLPVKRESLRTNEEPSRLSEADVVAAQEARERSGWVDNLSSYTGCRYVRGTHGQTAVADILGTEPPPAGWEHSRPTRAEVAAALAERQSA